MVHPGQRGAGSAASMAGDGNPPNTEAEGGSPSYAVRDDHLRLTVNLKPKQGAPR